MEQRTVIVVGGGLAGPLASLFLARRGYTVELFERRGDPRREAVEGGRSINLTLAERGLHALRRLGLEEEVVRTLCTPLRGRAVHRPAGTAVMPYGRLEHEVLYAVSRAELTRYLLGVAAAEQGVRLHFHQQCDELDRDTAAATFLDVRTGERRRWRAGFVVGADGVYSAVRRQMQASRYVDFAQYYVPWRYKELTIAAGSGFDRNALHVWPRGERMMFAIPNRDGSFNGVCVLPEDGPDSFATLHTPDAVRAFFERDFADAVPHLPDLEAEFLGRPEAAFPTVKTSAWRHRDRVVLIGDACHGVIPFYGQGMNAAFEDCVILDEHLARYPDREAAFEAYERTRRPDTDALADLCVQNFTELRDTVQRPRVAAAKQVALLANRVLGDRAMPLYTMVSHSTIPYADCVRRARRQERVARLLGADLAIGAVAATMVARDRLREVRPRLAALARPARRPAASPASAASPAARPARLSVAAAAAAPAAAGKGESRDTRAAA